MGWGTRSFLRLGNPFSTIYSIPVILEDQLGKLQMVSVDNFPRPSRRRLLADSVNRSSTD